MTALGIVQADVNVTAAGAGGWAAMLWYRASRVYAGPLIDVAGFEPVEPQLRTDGRIAAAVETATMSAELNARAARWSGVAAGLTALSIIVGWIVSGIP